MIWSENEIASFLHCTGIDITVCRSIQRCTLKGVHELIEMPDRQMKSRFGLTSLGERLVVRKALKRFLELDRWENAVRGRRLTEWTDDVTLREFTIPLQELRIEVEISQGGFGTVSVGSFAPTRDRGSFKAGSEYKVAVKEMKG